MLLKRYDEHVEFENFLKMIDKDCQPYIKLLKDLAHITSYHHRHQPIFLRGMSEDDNLILKKVRKDRTPLDSVNQVDNTLVDDIFYDKMGVRPRSEGIFTSTNSATANLYGIIYMVFPIGDFDYVASDSWVDMIDAWSTYYEVFNDFESNGNEESKEIIDKYGNMEDGKVPRKWIEHVIEEYGKNGNEIKTAVKEGQEVVFICDEYYAIKYDKESLNRIIKWLK